MPYFQRESPQKVRVWQYIVKTHGGVIAGAKALRNEYDGHTLEQALGQVAMLTGQSPRQVVADRGYRGRCWVGSTRILVPDKSKKQLSRYEQEKLRKTRRKRAGIEAVIAHLKTDHRLSRNFYKGVFGDNVNVMIAAAAFNFKRMMNKWKRAWEYFWRMLLHLLYLICRRDYWV